jgi:signal transduction histidine kinase
MAFVAGVFGVDRVQRRRVIEREREQARLRELEQAREIERAYHELRETKDRLVQQEKLASLGQLTAGIAHEIKNPLNFINNFADINAELATELREAYEANPEIALGELLDVVDDLKQNAGVIAQHGRRADAIVRSMMQHASGASGSREAVDLNALVGEYVDLAYHGRRAVDSAFSVQIERDFSADVGSVSVVAQDIGRVILNLVGNAFDALSEFARAVDSRWTPRVRVSTRRVGSNVEIRISDNGPGIPETVRERIFEPFFTTKPAGSGTGLGLSLSFEIVTQGHGGTFTLQQDNEPALRNEEVAALAGSVHRSGGATFVITLPV